MKRTGLNAIKALCLPFGLKTYRGTSRVKTSLVPFVRIPETQRRAQTQNFETMGIIAALAVTHVTIKVFQPIGKREADLNFEETDLERRSL